MPELPEVQALVDFLAERTDGLAVTGSSSASFWCSRLQPAAAGARRARRSTAVHRHGKFLDIDADGTHLVFHLARAGWLRWSDALPATVAAAGQVADRAAGAALRRLGLRPDRGRHEEVARGLHRHATPPRCPASRGSGPTRWPTTSPSSRSLRCSTAGAPRSRACCATRSSSPASATPTPTRSSTSPRSVPFAIAGSLAPEVVDRLYAALRDTLAERGRDGVGQAGQGAQGRQAGRHARARAAPARPARSAATSCARCRSPTRRCSTAPPARPAASRWPTAGCRKLLK